MKGTLIRKYILLFFFSLVLSSCMNLENDISRDQIKTNSGSIMTEKPLEDIYLYTEQCHFPCWEGITPGVTTEDEMKKILSDKGIKREKDQVEYTIGESGYTEVLIHNNNSFQSGEKISVYYFEKQNQASGSIYVVNKIVYSIEFQVTRNITLDNLVKIIGNPDSLIVIFEDYLIGDLFFNESGICCHIASENMLDWSWSPPEAAIGPEMEISFLSFHEPVESGTMKEPIYQWIYFDPRGLRDFSDYVQPWMGYGNYHLVEK